MISVSAGLSYGKELAAVLAGPLANLLWGLLLAWLGGPWLVPAGANLVLCAFNLLPVRPLDGGRALELLVSWAAGPAAGERGCPVERYRGGTAEHGGAVGSDGPQRRQLVAAAGSRRDAGGGYAGILGRCLEKTLFLGK